MSIVFWIVYIVCILLGAWGAWSNPEGRKSLPAIGALWLLVGLLGWKVFGDALR